MAAVCESCHEPLVLTIGPDSDDDEGENGGMGSSAPETVPDDVHLKKCGHHFHWDCLLSAYTSTCCPSCDTDLVVTADGASRILCDLDNEGGLQQDKDILPLLAEEGYLKTYPEERRARAFLEFCRQGDLDGVISVLQDEEDDDQDVMRDGPSVDVLRYQDAMGDQESTLQAAVAAGSQEIAWLLLFLASNLPLGDFPQDLLAQAQSMGFTRRDMDVKSDVRSLRDAQDRTAADTAPRGSVWEEWVTKGRLSI